MEHCSEPEAYFLRGIIIPHVINSNYVLKTGASCGQHLTNNTKSHPAFVHSSATCSAGTKWREENNLPRSGNEYGPLTDRPDWSYADGRPSPPSKGAIKRKQQQEELAIRIDQLAEEVLMAKENYQRSLQATADEEVKRQRRQLKPKGELTSKLSPNRNRRKKQRKQGAVE
ncbi:putative 39S ribosomal protein L52, mitochondrial [Apostichopus japonicus]|uniref:Large ribosomal subunit protein mL52 n=1 Tax=Stichopus japonicus TaxID=307972 RepID=A0A2G8LCU6_STIJA|nr:putative 39S ribosomal protein L52, mitochondrial [Apostichopus japonicus]